MAPPDLPALCRECAGCEPCSVSIDADGAVWFMANRYFNPACPVLRLVTAIGAFRARQRQGG